MRAKINHGNRGTNIETLLKRYEFEHPQQYYNYIVESYINGHKEQVIDLFNRMKGDLQKSYLLNVQMMHPVYGEKIHDLIIKSL